MTKNKTKTLKTFFSYSFQIDQMYTKYHFFLYKKYILNTKIVFFEIKDCVLYSSTNLNIYFRHDLYALKLFELNHRNPKISKIN